MAAFFAATIFLGSFLLFQVELIVAKIILPWFGGVASVWTTCMLFFQIMLLLGYLYAHGLARFARPRVQFFLHAALLASAALLLPVLPSASWKPDGTEVPAVLILTMLTSVVGLPFLLLSSTSPLLSSWFTRAFPGKSPYWLYAMSNLGSMLGLLSYPTLVEPNLAIKAQAYAWSAAFLAFSAMCVYAAAKSAFAPAPEGEATPARGGPEAESPSPGELDRFFWIALPACGSVLLLGVTNHLAQNVVSLPFLWVAPLSLYLLSFILAFSGPAMYPRAFYAPLLAASVVGMTVLCLKTVDGVSLKILIPVFLGGMFAGCMVCHGELARMAPHPRYLTPYYLAVSAGGALGGIFVGVAAPQLFRTTHELPLGIAACSILALASMARGSGGAGARMWLLKGPLALACAVSVAGAAYFFSPTFRPPPQQRLAERNFYGVLKVAERGAPGRRSWRRIIYNGSVDHGIQFLSPERKREAVSFYHPGSGVGLAIRSRDGSKPVRVGVIGLGAGILATYGRPGDVYRFYEINPLVVKVAKTEFSYLNDTAAGVEVVLGDARLSMEREPSQRYDVFVVDAFSGDSIPAHLLTREALDLYLRHLERDGVLAFHITNWYIDLKPVLGRHAMETGMKTLSVVTEGNKETGAAYTRWVLLSADPENFRKSPISGAGTPLPASPDMPLWTDDYSSLIPLLGG